MKRTNMDNYYCQYDVKRGDIYFINLGGSENRGSEQQGLRPCLVIQNDTGNKFSPTIIVVPLTSKVKKLMPTHVQFNLKGTESVILCEHIRTVSKQRIVEYIDYIDVRTLEKVEKALLTSLGF